MGFFEILLIAIVTLLVVGPERMPEAIRQMALNVGRAKRYLDYTRKEIEGSIGLDEVQEQIDRETIKQHMDKVNEQVSDIDQRISSGEQSMPWTEEDYQALQDPSDRKTSHTSQSESLH